MEKEWVVLFHNYGISPEKMSSEFLNRETFSWKPVNLFLSHTLTELLRSVITAWPEVYIFHAKWNASIVVVQNVGWKHRLLNKHVFVTNNLELCETVRSKSETNKWWQKTTILTAFDLKTNLPLLFQEESEQKQTIIISEKAIVLP